MTAREMKDSGVEWIGTIPACWEVHRIKTNFDIIGGNGFSPSLQGQETGDLPVCKASDISNAGAKLSKAENFITFSEAKLYSFNLIPKGSVLFAKIGEAMKKNNRTLTLVECCADNNCQAMVPKKIDSQFSYYLFNCIDMTWFDNAGTVPCISNQKLKNSKIPYPSIFEQKRIAKYLNTKCAEIDSLTADIERQIETLQEYKKSVITEAVTKGLDPNVEMKDSGVEWIGNIPQHWKVVPLKYLGLVRNGLTYKPTDLLDEGVPVLRSTNIQNGRLDLTDVVYVNNKLAQQYMLKKGDILVCSRNGSAKLIGKNAYIGESNSYAFGAFMMVFSSKLGEYGYYLLNSALFPYYKPLFTTSTINQLTGKQFGEMKVPLAPEFERQIITKYLKEQVSCIEVSIEEKQKQLEILAQYKQSLIYEYVTGKKAVPM